MRSPDLGPMLMPSDDASWTPPPGSTASSLRTRRSMLSNRRRDTKPELSVRRELHRRGFRYRVDHPPIESPRRRADIVFTRHRVAVFIDGCFWHGCPDHCKLPKTNTDYWHKKIAANAARDTDTDHALRTAGWTVMRFWAHVPRDQIVESVVSVITPSTMAIRSTSSPIPSSQQSV